MGGGNCPLLTIPQCLWGNTGGDPSESGQRVKIKTSSQIFGQFQLALMLNHLIVEQVEVENCVARSLNVHIGG